MQRQFRSIVVSCFQSCALGSINHCATRADSVCVGRVAGVHRLGKGGSPQKGLRGFFWFGKQGTLRDPRLCKENVETTGVRLRGFYMA